MPDRLWHPALDQDGALRDGSEVTELTGMVELPGYPTLRVSHSDVIPRDQGRRLATATATRESRAGGESVAYRAGRGVPMLSFTQGIGLIT
ncbi:hypothetical protein [Streptomyces tunisiensis]|uniref:hypothetical protein n=1 Tax=Streptomyces tunisiensis TaxID=948699 RepID=UPI003EE2214C